MNLSAHFSLAELTKSQTALRQNIQNTPSAAEIKNLKAVCENILEPVRSNYNNTPFSPTSGYRSKELNTAIGGSKTSQHMKGEAVDFEVPGVSNFDLASWIATNLEFDQLILEFYTSGVPHSGWVHCSYKKSGGNRKQTLTINSVHRVVGLQK